MLFINKILNLFILRNKWATTFVITSMLLLSAAVLWGLHTNLERIEESRLQTEMSRVKSLVIDKIDSQVTSLNAVRGLFALTGEPSPRQFQIFVSGILASQQKSAATHIGYTKFFAKKDTASIEKGMRSLGRKAFTIWPKTSDPHHAAIILMEPISSQNYGALGFDTLSDQSRRSAMLSAMENGEPTLSVPYVRLFSNSKEKNTISIYVPYFGKGIVIPDTVEERRNNIKGFLYAPVHVKEFFESAIGGSSSLSNKINLTLEMADSHTGEITHLYTRYPNIEPRFSNLFKEETFAVKNQNWTLRLSPTQKLLTTSEELLVWTAWASVLILIVIVLYIVKKTQLFIMEEERRKQLLLEASTAKSSFLANMSHEIRTPLGAIVGFTDLICNDKLPKEQKLKFVANIEKNVQLLARIIDDVLDHSRLEAGKLPIEKREISLPTLLQEVDSVMQLHAQKKDGLVFQVHSRGKIPSNIVTDEVRIKQILTNLIGNSLKFTKKGRVTLTVQCPIHPLTNKHYLEFLVEDTGIGIPQETQKNLFEGFVQADASTTRMFGGTGLGLALCKKLANLLGGDVELVKSFPGKGSLFRVYLQIESLREIAWVTEWKDTKAARLQTDEEIESPPSLLNKKRILLVEDSEDNQEIFKIFLESAGAHLEIVGNGIDAVETTKRKSFDLILMDIQIPGIDGKEATRQIRSHGYKGPIVALTAHAMPNEIESCLESGCNGQITKPVTGEQLIRETEAYL